MSLLKQQFPQHPLVNVHSWGPEVGTINNDYGRTSRAWAAASRAIYVPLFIPIPLTIRRFFSYNGSPVSGNIDIGLYDRGGARIVSTGSTAQVGTTQAQEIAVTATRIGKGSYWLALALDNTTGELFGGGNGVLMRTLGIQQQSTAFPLPAQATMVAASSIDYPIFGFGTGAFL